MTDQSRGLFQLQPSTLDVGAMLARLDAQTEADLAEWQRRVAARAMARYAGRGYLGPVTLNTPYHDGAARLAAWRRAYHAGAALYDDPEDGTMGDA
jgi:hypothetical protein